MFERFMNKGHKESRTSPLRDLQVGEILYFTESFPKLSVKLHYHRRKGKEFEYELIKNGILIKRIK